MFHPAMDLSVLFNQLGLLRRTRLWTSNLSQRSKERQYIGQPPISTLGGAGRMTSDEIRRKKINSTAAAPSRNLISRAG